MVFSPVRARTAVSGGVLMTPCVSRNLTAGTKPVPRQPRSTANQQVKRALAVGPHLWQHQEWQGSGCKGNGVMTRATRPTGASRGDD